MCGRYSEAKNLKEIAERFDLEPEEEDYQPTYNASPTMKLPVITNTDPQQLSFMQWSLIPHWSKTKEIKSTTFNAKAETLTEAASYRALITSKRCLVPAAGFYEWKKITPPAKDMFGNDIPAPKTKQAKQPYFINLKNDQLFSFAGLWDEWVDKASGEVLHSFTIITTEANALVKPIHDRMPVILSPEAEKLWLAGNLPKEELLALLQPFNPEEMKAVPIKAIDSFVLNSK